MVLVVRRDPAFFPRYGWRSTEWSECRVDVLLSQQDRRRGNQTSLCGGGIQTREVYCVQISSDPGSLRGKEGNFATETVAVPGLFFFFHSWDLHVFAQPCGRWPVSSVWICLRTPPSFVTSAVPWSVRCLRGAPGDPAPTRTARTSPPRKVTAARRRTWLPHYRGERLRFKDVQPQPSLHSQWSSGH